MDVLGEQSTAERRHRLLPLVLLLSGPLAAGAVLLVGGLRADLAVLTGCLFSGGVAVLSGALVLFGAGSRSPLARPALLLIGTAMVTWGIGQALVGYSAAGGATFPTVGDVFSTVSAPFGIAGLLVALRGGGRHSGSLRFALDSLLVAAFGAREAVSGYQRRRLLTTLTEHAVRDPLTALMNRRGLSARLREARCAGEASLLTLDLDGFKEVNDILGHSRGDDLLVAVSRRIEAALPADAQAFRIGGDEFAIVVPGPTDHVSEVATLLLDAVQQAADHVPGAAAVGVTASVGVARVDDPEERAGRRKDPLGGRAPLAGDSLGVLVESSAALRAAKTAGRNRVEYYDGAVAAAHRRALLVERRLHVAVAHGDIDVHYQPIISLRTGRVVAVEALARWTDPVVGRVGPDEFIPLAEQCGLISALGAAVLRRAVEDLAWASDQLPDLSVAVNASAVQVRHATFAEDMLNVAEAAGLSPDRLTIEVTESVFVDADDPALAQLTRLRQHGLDIAIDDFGSGFSALSYLSRLPASVLKIDQSLTRQLGQDDRALAVLGAVAALAQTMPMWVVVEGIETPETEKLVRAAGVGNGQGWLYSPAVPIDELPDTVARVQGASQFVKNAHAPVGTVAR